MGGDVKKFVIAISSAESGETLERWVFNVETDAEVVEKGVARSKSEKEVQKEIQAIIRQITASVSFLPLLSVPCTFDILIYTATDTTVPASWEESDPKYIAKSQEVRLRSFSTKVHKVDAMVAYKFDEDEEGADEV